MSRHVQPVYLQLAQPFPLEQGLRDRPQNSLIHVEAGDVVIEAVAGLLSIRHGVNGHNAAAAYA